MTRTVQNAAKIEIYNYYNGQLNPLDQMTTKDQGKMHT